MSLNQSVCGLVSNWISVGNLSKYGEIHESHNTLSAEDVYVNEPNTIETSVSRASDDVGEKLNTGVSTEVILPGICDALTTEDFNVDGANTLKISPTRKSLFAEDGKMPEDTELQDRNDFVVDKMELYINMPKFSLVDRFSARFVMDGMLRT